MALELPMEKVSTMVMIRMAALLRCMHSGIRGQERLHMTPMVVVGHQEIRLKLMDNL